MVVSLMVIPAFYTISGFLAIKKIVFHGVSVFQFQYYRGVAGSVS